MTSGFSIGQRVIWCHTMRGGYGYLERIPGAVVKIGRGRVCIRVPLHNGQEVLRWVSPHHLEVVP